MALSESLESLLRTLEREHRDEIIREQSTFSGKMFEINAVQSSQFSQGMAKIARQWAFRFIQTATKEVATVVDLKQSSIFEETVGSISNIGQRLLSIGAQNVLHPALNQPANIHRALSKRELEIETRDRLQVACTKRQKEECSPASNWNLLVLVSNPTNEEAIAANSEFRDIRTAIREATFRDQINVEVEAATRTRDIIRAINEHHPRVIHFCGHSNDSCLVLLSERNEAKPFDSRFLAEILAADDSDVELVILNSCDSLPQAGNLLPTVPHVIGTIAPLYDNWALDFSRVFYSSIAYGKSISSAYLHATAYLGAEHGSEAADLYQLRSADGHDPKEITLTGEIHSTITFATNESLSSWEEKILKAVPPTGDIHTPSRDATGEWVQTGETYFRDDTDGSVAASGLQALNSLIGGDFVRHNEGIHYKLTGAGWEAKRSLGE